MLMQTNSYIVPKDRRAEHARLLRRFRQTLQRLGCDHFEVYEQVGQNWSAGETTSRFVQIMRFRDRKHQQAVQAAERSDPSAQQLIAEFCELINFPYQQQQGLFAVGFYTSFMKMPSLPQGAAPSAPEQAPVAEATPPAESAEPMDAADLAAPLDLLETPEEPEDPAALGPADEESSLSAEESLPAQEDAAAELNDRLEEPESDAGGNGLQDLHNVSNASPVEQELMPLADETASGEQPAEGEELLTPLEPIEDAPEGTLDDEPAGERDSFERRVKH